MQQKIPYGLSNFKSVISEGYIYVDKTDYIAKLEAVGKFNILMRPRRFGKSLFLSMLEYYYDIAYVADFDALFSELYIGKHPTALKSSYQVLFMEFSGIETSSYESIYRAFNTKIEFALRRFLQHYHYPTAYYADIKERASPYEKIDVFFSLIEQQKSSS